MASGGEGTFLTDVDIEERSREQSKTPEQGKRNETEDGAMKVDDLRTDGELSGTVEVDSSNPRHKKSSKVHYSRHRGPSFVEEAERNARAALEELEKVTRELDVTREEYSKTQAAIGAEERDRKRLEGWKSKFSHVCANLDNALHVMALLKEELGMREELQHKLEEESGKNEKIATDLFATKADAVGTAYGMDTKGVGLHGRTPGSTKKGTPTKDASGRPSVKSSKKSTKASPSMKPGQATAASSRQKALLDMRRRVNAERKHADGLTVNVEAFKRLHDEEITERNAAHESNRELTEQVANLRKNLVFLSAQVDELEHRKSREDIEVRRLNQSMEIELQKRMREASMQRTYGHRSEMATVRRNGVQMEGGSESEATVNLLREKLRDSLLLQRKLKRTRGALERQLAELKDTRKNEGLLDAVNESFASASDYDGGEVGENDKRVWLWDVEHLANQLKDSAHQEVVRDKVYDGAQALSTFDELEQELGAEVGAAVKDVVRQACLDLQCSPPEGATSKRSSFAMWLWNAETVKLRASESGLSPALGAKVTGKQLVLHVRDGTVVSGLLVPKESAPAVEEAVRGWALTHQMLMCS